ncbi:MAG: ATP-dependent Clp protease ATP-binding subunit ClpX, partial [Clostridia bacterium]|nr:ATP-dependent Clp protease ATP-binding subunit ClpX [Clostridia bacterium]
GDKVIGFGSKHLGKGTRALGEVLAQVRSDDMLKYGLIPEFVGRLPVLVALEPLDETALQNILTRPKNALVKQYEKLLGMDEVALKFDPEALKEIARIAIDRKSGARALRSILEEIMMDTMFEIPSREDVESCVITKKTVTEKEKPKLVLRKMHRKPPAPVDEAVGQ